MEHCYRNEECYKSHDLDVVVLVMYLLIQSNLNDLFGLCHGQVMIVVLKVSTTCVSTFVGRNT